MCAQGAVVVLRVFSAQSEKSACDRPGWLVTGVGDSPGVWLGNQSSVYRSRATEGNFGPGKLEYSRFPRLIDCADCLECRNLTSAGSMGRPLGSLSTGGDAVGRCSML